MPRSKYSTSEEHLGWLLQVYFGGREVDRAHYPHTDTDKAYERLLSMQERWPEGYTIEIHEVTRNIRTRWKPVTAEALKPKGS